MVPPHVTLIAPLSTLCQPTPFDHVSHSLNLLLYPPTSPSRPQPWGALGAGGDPTQEGSAAAGDPEAPRGAEGGHHWGGGPGGQYGGQVRHTPLSSYLSTHLSLRISLSTPVSLSTHLYLSLCLSQTNLFTPPSLSLPLSLCHSLFLLVWHRSYWQLISKVTTKEVR